MSRQRLRVVSPPARQEVAIYARVSSDQQAERHTIDSQLSELNARASEDGHRVRDEMQFIDNGHSGASLVRPALERLRDVVRFYRVESLTRRVDTLRKLCYLKELYDVVDGLIGAVIGGFEPAIGAVARVRAVMESAVGERAAEPLMEEEEEQSGLGALLAGEAIGITGGVALDQTVPLELA